MQKQDGQPSQWYQEDFLASLSPQPGSEEARTMTVTSGQKCLELSRSSGPLGSLARMLLESSAWRSTRCFLTWKASATPSRRLLFRLVPSMPRTGETVSPLWATPNTMDHLPQRSAESLQRQATTTRKGRTRPANLREQVCEETVRMWPTPTARDCKGANSMEHLATGNHVAQLANAVKLYQTPTTGAGLCGGSANYQRLKELEADGTITPEERRSMANGNGGQLNPAWVEWLMGFPIGWTDLNASETQ